MSKAIDIWKSVMTAIIMAVVFLVVVTFADKYFASRSKTFSVPGHMPEGYKQTIADSVNGVVSAIETHSGRIYVIGGKRLRFSYDPNKLPQGSDSTYPKDYIIQVGDSIVKNAKSDTFYVFRGDQRWQYIFPVIVYDVPQRWKDSSW
jgi:hypothetical protein